MQSKGKALLIIGILIFCSFTGCNKEAEKIVENNSPLYSYVDWEQGFQKGALSEGSQIYSTNYWELSHNPPEDYTYSIVEDIRQVGDNYLDFCRYSVEEENVYYL